MSADIRILAFLAIVRLAVLGVLADVAIKTASETPRPLHSGWLFAGAAVYALTALGWVFVLQHVKLAVVGAIYCVATMVLLAIAGTLFFKESLRASEVAGIALAVVSVWLLRRFG